MQDRRGSARFVGRDEELDALDARFRAGARQITVVGAPGIGKTSLVRCWLLDAALERDGWSVHVIAAGGLRDRDALVRSVACALGSDATAEGAVLDALRRRATVLFLDELEHLADDARATFDPWLDAVEELAIVATSRVRLGGGHERVIELGPLAPLHSQALLRRCLDDAAVPVKGDAIPRLAHALDGVPLAIELAAARCRVLPPDELAHRHERGDAVLGGELETELDDALALLSPDARLAFAELAVFEGPFDAVAAEAVCSVGAPLDALQALRDMSLLHADGDRLHLLTPFRAAALRRLPAADRNATEARHDGWTLRYAAHAARLLEAGRWRDAIEALADAQAELVAAARRARRWEDRAALLVALDELRRGRGTTADLAAWMDEALSADVAPEHAALAADLGLRRANLALHVSDHTRASSLAADAVARRPVLSGDPRVTWIAVAGQLARGDFDGADATLTAALDAARARSDRHAEASLHGMTAELRRMTGQTALAVEEGERALLSMTHPLDRASNLASLSFIASEQGAPDDAERYAREGLGCLEAAGISRGRTRAALKLALGRAQHRRGELADALELMAEAMAGPDAFVASFATFATAMVRIEQGRLAEAEGLMQSVLDAVRRHLALYGVLGAALLAAVEARLGRTVRARARMEELSEAALPPFAQRVVDDCAHVVGSRRAPLAPVEVPDGTPFPIEARVARALRTAHDEALPIPRLRVARLRVSRVGAWVEAAGARVSVSRRPVMRGLLIALAEAHGRRPGEALSYAELLACGWGDERMSSRSERRRLEVMVSRIRALGVEDALETTERGYRLHPECVVELVDDA